MGIKNKLARKPEGQGRLPEIVLKESAREEAGLKFDVETEVGEERFEKIKRYFEENCEEGSWGFAISAAICLQILFPERINELHLEDRWAEMKEGFGKNQDVNFFQDNTFTLNTAKYFKKFIIGKEDGSGLEEDWESMVVQYERYCKKDLDKDSEFWRAVSVAAQIKILFPDKVGELKLEDRWAEIKAEYEQNCKHDDWWFAADMAMNLKILAAHKVKITSKGLELVEEEEGFSEEIEKRPVRSIV